MRCSARGALDVFGSFESAISVPLPRLCLPLIFLFACISTTAFSQPAATFTPLGLLGGTQSFAHDVSADGSVVVGFVAGVPGLGTAVFHWKTGTVMLHEALIRDGAAVSGDGSVVVGSYNTSAVGIQAFRWPVGGPFEGLGDFPGGSPLFESAAFDASANGSVVVGYGTTNAGSQAFRWTQASGMVGLGPLPSGFTESAALGVSADGAVVVGHSEGPSVQRQAFRWTAESGIVRLGGLPGAFESIARKVSADGQVVVGNSNFEIRQPGDPTPTFQSQAFRWTENDGMVPLFDLGETYNSRAVDVSANGREIVGTIGRPFPSFPGDPFAGAFYFTAETGRLNLKDLLISAGATGLDGWSLFGATGVSADGLTVC